MALDILEQQRWRLFTSNEIGDRRSFEIGIDFRGDALEFAEQLDLLQPSIEIARVGSARSLLALGFCGLRLARGPYGDAHVHIRLRFCCVSTQV